MRQQYDSCRICPKECGVNRNLQRTGHCKSGARIKAARAALHFWEEPCISGDSGSGTVFFSGCNLHCIFCQNRPISDASIGAEISEQRLSEIFLELQLKGAENINLVTPGHYIVSIIPAIKKARKAGLNIPVVYNTGAYEKTDAIQLLDGYVDVYLPDLKYMDSNLSGKYSGAPDYFHFAKRAIHEMVKQVGRPKFDKQGRIIKGVIVRHLMLPGCLKDSKNIIRYLHEAYKNNIYISIMNQYTPMEQAQGIDELGRKVTEEEYGQLIKYALSIGIENGYIQEGETAEESFIPDFNCMGIL